MSSTNRSAVRDPEDHYRTPDWVTELLPLIVPAPRTILDPGCGEGAIGAVLRRVWPEATIYGVEVNPERAQRAESRRVYTGVVTDDFLELGPVVLGGPYDLVAGNPPYSKAREFIERSLEIGTTVAMLLRLNFLGAKKRIAFHKRHPADVYILSPRPSFARSVKCKKRLACGWGQLYALDEPYPHSCLACGGDVSVTANDSTEYAWFVYGEGRGGRYGHLEQQ